MTILNALVDFDEQQFRKNMPVFYEQVINLLLQEMSPDIRLVLHSLLSRCGFIFGILVKESVPEHPKNQVSYVELVSKTSIPTEDGEGSLGVSEETAKAPAAVTADSVFE